VNSRAASNPQQWKKEIKQKSKKGRRKKGENGLLSTPSFIGKVKDTL